MPAPDASERGAHAITRIPVKYSVVSGAGMGSRILRWARTCSSAGGAATAEPTMSRRAAAHAARRTVCHRMPADLPSPAQSDVFSTIEGRPTNQQNLLPGPYRTIAKAAPRTPLRVAPSRVAVCFNLCCRTKCQSFGLRPRASLTMNTTAALRAHKHVSSVHTYVLQHTSLGHEGNFSRQQHCIFQEARAHPLRSVAHDAHFSLLCVCVVDACTGICVYTFCPGGFSVHTVGRQ